ASGFSTADQVSQLAGRGVGMDVVRNEVRQLGGSVDIQSVRGQGVRFTLRLPQGTSQEVVLALPGRHNVLNALAAAAVGWQLGVAPDAIARALEAFAGVGRRFND
ncbi:ATP-binding protein, partial [Enterobacter hormaechei]|uniref:ATP-binding protein n=1 Tax=Enterobacter hormaechei TaxID=158836 RepID=UPI002040A325